MHLHRMPLLGARAESVRPMIAETAHLSLRSAADELNRRSLTTASGSP